MRYTIPSHDGHEEIVIEVYSSGLVITQKRSWGESHFIEVGSMLQKELLIKTLMDIQGND